MVLDTSLLTISHLLLFGGCFCAAFGILGALLRPSVSLLRVVSHVQPTTYYAGAVLIGIVTFVGYIVLDDPYLKIGLLSGGFLTLLIGIVDEQRPLTPTTQWYWQAVTALVVVAAGWVVSYVSNPWGSGVIYLDQYQIGGLALPATLLSIVWLLLLMNAMNWLDGVDGLASGVGQIALLTLAALSLLPSTQDTQTLSLALVGSGALAGFLLWNFPPARVYLGTSGSWFLGLYLGMVAIVGGGKIVTTLLVLALPVIDLIVVSLQRVLGGHPPWQGDRERHLHFRLLRAGWNKKSVTIGAMVVTAMLGVGAIVLQTRYKLAALIITAAVLVLASLRTTTMVKSDR